MHYLLQKNIYGYFCNIYVYINYNYFTLDSDLFPLTKET